MSTIALVFVASSLGWVVTLCFVRDLKRLRRTEFASAIAGALLAGLLMPRLGLEVWGDSGLRIFTILAMALCSLLALFTVHLCLKRPKQLLSTPHWARTGEFRSF